MKKVEYIYTDSEGYEKMAMTAIPFVVNIVFSPLRLLSALLLVMHIVVTNYFRIQWKKNEDYVARTEFAGAVMTSFSLGLTYSWIRIFIYTKMPSVLMVVAFATYILAIAGMFALAIKFYGQDTETPASVKANSMITTCSLLGGATALIVSKLVLGSFDNDISIYKFFAVVLYIGSLYLFFWDIAPFVKRIVTKIKEK